jgi:hypothetical protein
MQTERHPSSYRDPSGFLFFHAEVLYRQVDQSYRDDYDLLMGSGFYASLSEKQLLVKHDELKQNFTGDASWYMTLKPDHIPFISYPYEWCFNMLREGALLTLDIALESMRFGMMLKDASAYNVQLHGGRMQFLDTLSFTKYNEAQPWIAYRQFCEHFLAPLALMHYLKQPLQQLFLAYPEGIPLHLARRMLPARSKFNLNHYLHLHLHGKMASQNSSSQQGTAKPFSIVKMKNLLTSLKEAVSSLKMEERSGVWSDYYNEARQRDDYVEQKKALVTKFLQRGPITTAIDVGANEGTFTELLSQQHIYTIAADLDHYSINKLYRRINMSGIQNVHPVVMDFSHPSPAIGVNNTERDAFINRVNVDLVLALAVIHHLSIGRNIPFDAVCAMFRSMGKTLIIEFIPKEDEKIKLMLSGKQDVYDWYDKAAFINSFKKQFEVVAEQQIGSSGRSLFLMQAYGH